jgi:hypothetical protein
MERNSRKNIELNMNSRMVLSKSSYKFTKLFFGRIEEKDLNTQIHTLGCLKLFDTHF